MALAIVKRDLEKKHLQELIPLPSGGNTSTIYLLILLLGGGSALFTGWVSIAFGIALICWQGIDPPKIDSSKLSAEEEYLLNLLDDQHPRTGETLDAIMKDCLGKTKGDRTIPAQVMDEIIVMAKWDTYWGRYGIDIGEEFLHVTTYAERRFCDLFQQATGRILSVNNPLPALGQSQRQSEIETIEEVELPHPPPVSRQELEPVIPAEPSLAAPKMYSPVDAIVPDDGTIKSTLIVGVPGAGKGMVVSNAIQKLRQVRPDLRIFVADPKASEKESGYWSWLPKSQLIREPMLSATPEDKEAWLFDAIEYFQDSCKNNGLLIIDELTILVNSLSQKGRSKFGDKIVSISSGGDSEGLYLWGIAQTASAKSLGLGDGSIRSVLKGIAIIGGDNAGAIKAVRRTDFVSHVDDQELARLRRKSQVDRAWYDGVTNAWYPMPVLPNLSGYDRDTRTQVGAKPKVQPENQQASEVQDQVISLIDTGLDSVGILQADQLQKAIKKKFQKDLLLKDVERFLVNLVQVWPKKYELISAAGSVSIQRRNLTGASDTQTTGYQRSSQQLTEQPRVPAAGA